MSDEKKTKNKKIMIAKIIIPILFVCIVAGVWFVKNYKKESGSAINKSDSPISDTSKSKGTADTDFDLHITDKIDLEKLKSHGVPIVIDFGADSCIPCKEMAPVLKELNSELKGKAIIKFVDVWKYRELADGYPVNLIPTQILIDANGKPYKPKDTKALELKKYTAKKTGEHIFTTHEGGLTKEQLLDLLKEMGMK